jgi:tRNA A37 methylthiotransferase MiaB
MYSLREKTKAHRTLVDDVPAVVKKERLARLNEVYERRRLERLDAMVGNQEVVLVEGKGETRWMGRSSGGVRINIEGSLPEGSIQKGDFVKVQTTRRQRGILIGQPLSVLSL